MFSQQLHNEIAKLFPEGMRGLDEEQMIRVDSIMNAARNLANTINKNCPNCVEEGRAIEKLQEAVYWATTAIQLRKDTW